MRIEGGIKISNICNQNGLATGTASRTEATEISLFELRGILPVNERDLPQGCSSIMDY